MNTAEIKSLDQLYIIPTYDRYPISIVKGEGVHVWDAEGKKYLDFLGGIAVNPLGHCHPEVVKAIIEQAHTLIHTSNLYYTKPALMFAELMIKNGALDRVFFCNSGAEANEAAIKLVRKYHWRKGLQDKYQIISAQHSFHGRTLGALAATGKPEIQQGFGPMPEGFLHVPWHDIDALSAVINEHTAAVLIEPVQGEGGVNAADVAYLQKVKNLCERVGALLIFDEIQCGLGRLGTLFAYQHFNVKPDVLTMAKGLANGLPFGMVCATTEAATGFAFGDHGTTFGGNPVAAAAARATVETLLKNNYFTHAKKMSAYLFQQLKQLQQKNPEQILNIRGMGLMVGLELANSPKEVLARCHEKGLLANITAGNVLRLLPPYIIDENDIDHAMEIIEQALVSL